MNYTKGEWKIGTFRPLSNLVIYVSTGNKLWQRDKIADCYDNEANAHLIAAAPDMYEALKLTNNAIADDRLLDDIEFQQNVLAHARRKGTEGFVRNKIEFLLSIRKALAKADGRQ